MDWKLDLDAEPQGSSSGFWYDLTMGGYIDLSHFITDEDQLEKAEAAIELLSSLETALEAAELLNEF